MGGMFTIPIKMGGLLFDPRHLRNPPPGPFLMPLRLPLAAVPLPTPPVVPRRRHASGCSLLEAPGGRTRDLREDHPMWVSWVYDGLWIMDFMDPIWIYQYIYIEIQWVHRYLLWIFNGFKMRIILLVLVFFRNHISNPICHIWRMIHRFDGFILKMEDHD
jgi:hypothetical protein